MEVSKAKNYSTVSVSNSKVVLQKDTFLLLNMLAFNIRIILLNWLLMNWKEHWQVC